MPAAAGSTSPGLGQAGLEGGQAAGSLPALPAGSLGGAAARGAPKGSAERRRYKVRSSSGREGEQELSSDLETIREGLKTYPRDKADYKTINMCDFCIIYVAKSIIYVARVAFMLLRRK